MPPLNLKVAKMYPSFKTPQFQLVSPFFNCSTTDPRTNELVFQAKSITIAVFCTLICCFFNRHLCCTSFSLVTHQTLQLEGMCRMRAGHPLVWEIKNKQTLPYLYHTAGPPSSSRSCTARACCRSRGRIQDRACIHHRIGPASRSYTCQVKHTPKHDHKFQLAHSLHFLLHSHSLQHQIVDECNCGDQDITNVFIFCGLN